MSVVNPKVISFKQWFKNNYSDQGECDECNNGKIYCYLCNGEGIVDCDSHESFENSLMDDGYIECECCDGKGFVNCQYCLGENIDSYYDIKLEYSERLAMDLKRYKEIMTKIKRSDN